MGRAAKTTIPEIASVTEKLKRIFIAGNINFFYTASVVFLLDVLKGVSYLKNYLKLAYSMRVTPDYTEEGCCYVACYEELPGCMSHGKTPAEAASNLEEAKKLYIEALLEKGRKIPSPSSSTTVIWRNVPKSNEFSEAITDNQVIKFKEEIR